MSLNLVALDFTPDKEDSEIQLLEALDELARNWDKDFSGENGEDYLWEDAKDEGYECNADYVFNYIKESIEDGHYNKYSINSIRYATIVEDYLDMWLGSDNYYGAYNYCQPALGCFAIAWNDESYY
jgi:hypothetical protein